jgi:cell division protein FtsQ
MGRRVAFSLAFARALPLRLVPVPSVSLPSVRPPSRRELTVAACAIAALGLAYVVARVTPLFAVKTIAVSGGSADLERDVRASLDDVVGSSLVALDANEVEDRIVGLAAVRAARVDRAFPHELVVVIEAERPAAVIRQGRRAWVVAESGTVIQEIELGELTGLPRIRSVDPVTLRPGDVVPGRDTRVALEVLLAVPPRFPVRIRSVGFGDGGLTALLGPSVELRLGPSVHLEAKLGAAAAVLRSLPQEERRALAYLDVAVPQRPVAGQQPQPESEG